MTIYPQFELRCDGGPGPYDCEPPVYANTVAQARRDAERAGWLIGRRGKDYCAEHRTRIEAGQ